MIVKKDYPAKYIRSFTDTDGNSVHVFEYRNHQYEVIDSGWKGGHQPAYAQHRMEQDHIDELIKKEKKWSKFKGENAQTGLDIFFDYVDDNDK